MSSLLYRLIALVAFILMVIYNFPSFALHDGTVIDIKQAPWTVGIFTPQTFCGGSILSPNFVLTAASCVEQ